MAEDWHELMVLAAFLDGHMVEMLSHMFRCDARSRQLSRAGKAGKLGLPVSG